MIRIIQEEEPSKPSTRLSMAERCRRWRRSDLWARLADDWHIQNLYRAMEELIEAKEQTVALFRARLPALAAGLKPHVGNRTAADHGTRRRDAP